MAETPGIYIEGLTELLKSLKAADVGLPKEMAAIHKGIAEPVAAAARSRVRSRSGDLAGTIRSLGSAKVARVVAGRKSVPYAGPNHYGWPGRFQGNPFLTDALQAETSGMLSAYQTATTEFLGRVWVTIPL